jgi:hypothetical protein
VGFCYRRADEQWATTSIVRDLTWVEQEIREWMVKNAITKLKKIVVDEMGDFCRHCGRPDVGMQCSSCKNAKFWKYRKNSVSDQVSLKACL